MDRGMDGEAGHGEITCRPSSRQPSLTEDAHVIAEVESVVIGVHSMAGVSRRVRAAHALESLWLASPSGLVGPGEPLLEAIQPALIWHMPIVLQAPYHDARGDALG